MHKFRSVCWSAILSLALAGSVAAQRPASAQKIPAQKNSTPKAASRKKGDRTVIDRFNRMSPEERRKALGRLPPERRRKIEEQLNQYNHMTPDQRRQLRSRLQAFNQLPPEKQNQARRLFRQFGELPQERQEPLRQEFENLRSLPDADRRSRINSDEFRNKYDKREQRILGDLSGLLSSEK